MKPENKKFLEDNRHHWTTLRDAQYLRHLDGNTRSEMQRVMGEEFRPGYTADLWCPPCVSEMVTTLYREFEKWEAVEAAKVQVPVEPEPTPDPPVVDTPIVQPVQVQANFPKHNKHQRR